MSAFVFRCPIRGLMVQGWTQEGKADPGEYTAYRCPACGSVHLVNPRTGRLASDDRAARKPDDEAKP